MMNNLPEEISFLFSGIVFGLSGGLTPGPLLTLVVSETLKHGVSEGVKISFVPLITDLPIVLATLFVISRFANAASVLGVISLLGAAFLVYLSYESLSFKGTDVDIENVKPQSFRKGVAANFLNPNPYVFWISIGAPMVVKAFKIDLIWAVLFVAAMYFFLVGSKIVVTLVVGKSRFLLKDKNYIYTVRFLGIVLLIFAILFLTNGLNALGVF